MQLDDTYFQKDLIEGQFVAMIHPRVDVQESSSQTQRETNIK
jgi:hypothetical protein